jgi:hypothetical protein
MRATIAAGSGGGFDDMEEVCRAQDKSSERARDFVAMQSAATDKLLKPPRGGGKSKE